MTGEADRILIADVHAETVDLTPDGVTRREFGYEHRAPLPVLGEVPDIGYAIARDPCTGELTFLPS